jgi:hypothetical protein
VLHPHRDTLVHDGALAVAAAPPAGWGTGPAVTGHPVTVRRTSDEPRARLVAARPASRSRRPRAVLTALALCGGLALTACGSNGAETGQDKAPSPTASVPPSSAAPEDLVPERPPTKKDGVVSIQGTVGAGVEAGCLLLTNAGGQYVLLGTVPPDVLGQEVIVTGIADEDLATTCQQGTPFTVSQVLRR